MLHLSTDEKYNNKQVSKVLGKISAETFKCIILVVNLKKAPSAGDSAPKPPFRFND